ncbi:uncharacterized protein YbjT (DUF2867 family) [Thermocatellispora tengchongensis]|uniref:Uncharacterized protein YbjT (DUF2867 family) n=1 Tax=Thermocatellispora tengchongensis TaxID=1073253 RepID=A0A840NX17_9ACTN|nr:NAD(P)H-binding protein [Thermocatellispora tengchongensis]MBB5133384.1 uncharacterized protein YbjT (DUF2867 family) [Thermocatellispora tengchongensis]
MSESILVTGGTGTLGRHVVPKLVEAGATVRVLARKPRGQHGTVIADLAKGPGLDEAVSGATTVVHLASDPRAKGADLMGTRRLLGAARRAGVRHLVYISIVGVDRHPYSYYRAKREAELLIEDSGVPYTILRTTQFHDLVLFAAQALTRLPVAPVPAGWRFQPVDAAEVGERLAALATAAPAGRVPDMGGPEILSARDLVLAYLEATGRRRPLVSVPVPGAVSAAFRNGVNLAPAHADGRRTFREFLAAKAASGPRAAGYGAA